MTPDPNAAGVFYAGSACGWPGPPIRACVPLVKSIDGGDLWRDITDGYSESTLVSLSAVPGRSEVVFAEFIRPREGTPEYDLAKSVDGALTWTPRSQLFIMPQPFRPHNLVGPGGSAVLAATDTTVYVTRPGSAERSTNGGDSFVQVAAGTTRNSLPGQVGLSPADPDRLYLAFDYPDIPSPGVPAGTFVFRFVGSLSSVSSPSSPGLAGFRVMGIGVSPLNANVFYLTGFYDSTTDRILKSTDGGATYTLLPFTPGTAIRGIAFDPDSPSHVYVATGTPRVLDGAIFESLDAGSSWTQVGPSSQLFDPDAITTLGSDVFIADRERGVYVFSRDLGNWLNLGYAGATVLAAAEDPVPVLYAGAPSGTVWRVSPPPFEEMQLDRASAVVGLPVSFGGLGVSGITPHEYQFRRYDPLAGWVLVQEYSPVSTYTWIPRALDAGPHMIEISVRAAGAADPVFVDRVEFFVEPRRDPVVAIPFRYNADSLMDVLVYNRQTGAWNIRVANALGQFVIGPTGGWSPQWDVSVADFNGDALDDFFLYSSTSGLWFKAINTGAGFVYFGQGWQPGFNVHVLDMNGDGRADVFAHNPRTGGGYACISLGNGTDLFDYTPTQFDPGFRVLPADFNGDGKNHLLIHRPIGGEYYKVISQGDGTFQYSGGGWAPGWTSFVVDLNGDDRSDVFLYNVLDGVSYRAVSTGDGTAGFDYVVEQWRHGWQVYPADFNDDGVSDLFVYDGASWEKVLNDGVAWTQVAGGWARWTINVADLNGDGRSDVLLFDPATGQWYQALTTSPAAFTYTSGVFQ